MIENVIADYNYYISHKNDWFGCGIYLNGSRNNIIQNSEFKFNNGNNVYFDSSRNNILKNNIISNANFFGAISIYFFGGINNTLSNNTIEVGEMQISYELNSQIINNTLLNISDNTGINVLGSNSSFFQGK